MSGDVVSDPCNHLQPITNRFPIQRCECIVKDFCVGWFCESSLLLLKANIRDPLGPLGCRTVTTSGQVRIKE